MSDQSGQPPYPPQDPGAPQPPAAPPYQPPYQPPAPAYAPPAQTPPTYAPPPAYGQPPSAPEPPKKKRKVWVWVLVVVLLLTCCGVGGCVALFGGIAALGVNQAETVSKADTAYSAAVAALSEVDKAAGDVNGSDPASVAAFTEKAKGSLDTAATQVGAARTEIGKLSESEGVTAYKKGLDETDKAIELLRQAVDELSGVSKFGAVAKEGVELYSSADSKMNTMITLMNKKQYTKAVREVEGAKPLFQQAREKFTQAAGMDPTAGMDKVIAYVDLQLEVVRYGIQLANYGAKGDTTGYNKVVPKINAANKRINAMAKPAALTDPNWGTERISALEKEYETTVAKADALITKARTLLNGGSSK